MATYMLRLQLTAWQPTFWLLLLCIPASQTLPLLHIISIFLSLVSHGICTKNKCTCIFQNLAKHPPTVPEKVINLGSRFTCLKSQCSSYSKEMLICNLNCTFTITKHKKILVEHWSSESQQKKKIRKFSDCYITNRNSAQAFPYSSFGDQ